MNDITTFTFYHPVPFNLKFAYFKSEVYKYASIYYPDVFNTVENIERFKIRVSDPQILDIADIVKMNAREYAEI